MDIVGGSLEMLKAIGARGLFTGHRMERATAAEQAG